MARPRWDVVVVGAGPAGAAAARAATQGGARTLLLERAELPRYKRCGGGLLGLSRGLTGIDLDPFVRAEVNTVTVTFDGAASWTRGDADPFLRMILRADLDAALVDSAQRAGADLRTGALVTGADEGPSEVKLQLRDGSQVRAGFVVAADGVSSRLAAELGAVCDQTDLGLEGEFPAPPGWETRALLDWGPVPGSYGWLFPKGDTVTAGVIGDKRQSGHLRAYYAAFVNRLGLGPPLLVGGHLTRVRTPDSPLTSAGGRILLAGDAAGWLEPWTREGISFALRSGRLAGEAAAAGDHQQYVRSATAALQPDVAAGQRVLAAYTAHPRVFHMALRSPVGWHEFRRLLAGQASLAGLQTRLPVRAALALLG